MYLSLCHWMILDVGTVNNPAFFECVEIQADRYWGESYLKLCKLKIELILFFFYLLPFLQFSK